MTINEIRQYMAWLAEGDQNIDKCLSLFQEKQQVMAAELRKLQECAEAVEYKVWYYEKAKEAGTISVHDTMRREDIPQRMQSIRSRMSHVGRLIPPEKTLDSTFEGALLSIFEQDGIGTFAIQNQIDRLLVETCRFLSLEHPDNLDFFV